MTIADLEAPEQAMCKLLRHAAGCQRCKDRRACDSALDLAAAVLQARAGEAP